MAVEASDRAEVDTARPFRSVREAVAVFGDRILVGESHSRSSNAASTVTIAPSNANANANANTSSIATKHEGSSSSSTITLSPNPMAESDETEVMPAIIVPMYSAPSSPPSLASSPSPIKMNIDDRSDVALSIEKLEAEVSKTRQEVAQLRKQSSEMEMAVASLNAQLHRGLSKIAEMEADKTAAMAARGSIGGETDVASTVKYWGGGGDGNKLAGSESYLPSFSHALSLGELDDDDDIISGGGRRRKAQKVKPIVPLIGDILFSKRKSGKEKGDGLYSGEIYSVMG